MYSQVYLKHLWTFHRKEEKKASHYLVLGSKHGVAGYSAKAGERQTKLTREDKKTGLTTRG